MRMLKQKTASSLVRAEGAMQYKMRAEVELGDLTTHGLEVTADC